MKKLLFTALLAVTVAVSAFAAGPDEVNYVALSNFKASFKRASDVTWSIKKDYISATFLYNNVRTEALYTPDGEFIGTNTAVALEELPVNAKRNFAKKYSDYTVKEAIRFEGNEEGAYFISAENDKEAVILKVNDNSHISIMKSTKK
jgi:hypothetical protein